VGLGQRFAGCLSASASSSKVLRHHLLYLIGRGATGGCSGSSPCGAGEQRSCRGSTGFRAAFYRRWLVSIVVASIRLPAGFYAGERPDPMAGWLALLAERLHPHRFFSPAHGCALPSVILVTLWKGLVYYMVIFLAGLQGISPELY